jgi:hypothetical protein
MGYVPDRKPRQQPRKLDNDAAFFEEDLRFFLETESAVVQLTEERYKDMDTIALGLLDELNDIVNGVFIDSQQTHDQCESGLLHCSSSGIHGSTSLTSRHKRLANALAFLQTRPEYRFSLATGPDTLLFILPPDGHGKKAMGHAKNWRAFLERLVAEAAISQGLQFISLRAMGLTAEQMSDDRPEMDERRASEVINGMIRKFRLLECADPSTHEIKLRLSSLCASPAEHVLDMFLSSCQGETPNTWHEARCGLFP